MVIAEASRAVNYGRLNLKGISFTIIYLFISYLYTLYVPFKIVASIILFINFITESILPLQSRGELTFRRRMIGTPNLNVRTCSGMPDKSSEFKNSVGYLTTLSLFITLSMEWYVVVSPGIPFRMTILIVFTCYIIVLGCQYNPSTKPLKISVILW